ncbi:MAG TPA: hypothetical protein VF886_14655 [Roseiarcus sp.]
MSNLVLTRRTGITATFALLAAVAGQSAIAQSRPAVRDLRVDVAPLRANVGEPTASWVQQGLPDQLAQALSGHLTAQGGTLVVRIDYVTLGPIKDSSARDNIMGVATIGNVEWPVRATTKYQASAIDQTLVERSNRQRVSQLVQALTFWLARDL